MAAEKWISWDIETSGNDRLIVEMFKSGPSSFTSKCSGYDVELWRSLYVYSIFITISEFGFERNNIAFKAARWWYAYVKENAPLCACWNCQKQRDDLCTNVGLVYSQFRSYIQNWPPTSRLDAIKVARLYMNTALGLSTAALPEFPRRGQKR